MLRLRLKKIGRQNQPAYRLVAMTNTARRDGLPIDELGYYNPTSKHLSFKVKKIIALLANGAQPTKTVNNLLKKVKIIS